jgi:hypothetical protein
MSSVVISGDTSGTIALAAPAVSGTNTITLPAVTGTAVVSGQNSAITAGTSQTLSGTSVSYTIPSWVKRITVILNAATVSGSASNLIQIGNGTAETTGYVALSVYTGSNSGQVTSTSGFLSVNGSSGNVIYGTFTLENLTGNTWIMTGQAMTTAGNIIIWNSGSKTTSGTVSTLKFTTSTGTDTLGGTINILYE